MPHFSAERSIITRQIANRLAELHATIHRKRTPISGWETVPTGHKQDVSPIPTVGWEPYTPGTPWGAGDHTQWFRATVTIPDDMAGETVVALLQPGGESLCYLNGVPAQGLDGNRQEVVLAQEAKAGEIFGIVLESYASPYYAYRSYECRFPCAELAARDDFARSFYWDVRVVHETALEFPENSQLRAHFQDLADQGIKRLDLSQVNNWEAFQRSLRAAQRWFRARVRDLRGSRDMGTMLLAGHSHIDTAWLWPLRETRRKLGRTFSTALKYMEEYPEFTFSQSQPQLYEYVKDHYPALYAKIKERVREGRWEPIGGAWVEQDTNLPSGEAHVRQFLYGNRFFRKEFGVHTRFFWMPDCFGFTYSMPQILKRAQIDAFATTKLNANEYNEFPYHLFRWRGLDGSEVLAYMLPGSCNEAISPCQMIAYWGRYKQKGLSDDLPASFGHGDGGGGPTPEMIETALRLKDMQGVPKAKLGLLQPHFDRVMQKVPQEKLPVYADELYFEHHRGCQTSQARTKRNNRKCELGLRDAEFLSSLALVAGRRYPQEELYGAWKLVLLNQFHDILPGSSVAEVYEDAEKDYAKVRAAINQARSAALSHLAAKVDTRGDGRAVVIINSLGWPRSEVVSIDIDRSAADLAVVDQDGKPVLSQVVNKPDGTRAILFETHGIPSLGHAVYRLTTGVPPATNGMMKVSETRLENAFYAVGLGKNGTISRLYDRRTRRDVLPKGSQGNELVLFDDRPAGSDAWEIDFNIDEASWPIDEVVSVAVTETGPVRGTVRVVKKSNRSTITQDISIYRTIPRIDFATSVEWHERKRLLKASFPVDVFCRMATYEIQYGSIERPTHRSTSHDAAQFEVPAHRWIDLSEDGYGVSLLNDCKYGFDVRGNVMRISLLRAPSSPDPNADQGHHEFTYSLYPHAGTWQEADTVRRAYELNVPLIAFATDSHPGDVPAAFSLASVDRPGVVIDCVKKAEDSDALIMRLYEAHGGRGPVRLTFADEPKSVVECDLMEENDAPVKCDGKIVSVDIKPWEIRTFKVIIEHQYALVGT